jgi:Protein of unknown function (DUF4019)
MSLNTRHARAMLRVCSLLAILFVGGALVSCGSSKKIQLAKDSVGMFHAQLDTEQYSTIYKTADDKFHAAISEAEFVKLLQAVHNKLGTVKESNLRNTGVAWYAGQGYTVTLVYDTRFSDGSGAEQFVWRVKDNQPTLYGYHINSNDLIAK